MAEARTREGRERQRQVRAAIKRNSGGLLGRRKHVPITDEDAERAKAEFEERRRREAAAERGPEGP